MIRTMLISLLAAGMFSVAQAAVLVTADNAGEASEQYFDRGHSCLSRVGSRHSVSTVPVTAGLLPMADW